MFESLAEGQSEYVNEGHQVLSTGKCDKLPHFKITTKRVITLSLEPRFPLGDETKPGYLRKFYDNCKIQIVHLLTEVVLIVS